MYFFFTYLRLSSALREIDKRRKLVKELDKYAMCKKLIETDKGKEISDLVAKITSLSPSERRIKENRCDGVDGLNLVCSGLDGSGDTIEKEEEKKGEFTVPHCTVDFSNHFSLILWGSV